MSEPKDARVAFVAGATGFTGREIVAQLAGEPAGWRVVAHVRPDSARLEEWRARFAEAGAEVDATPWEVDALADTFRRLRPALVFCAIGTVKARGRAARKRGGREESYETVDYGLTRMLLDALAAAGVRPERFLYISAAGVSPRAPGAYARWRWRAEEAVRSSGLPYTIARPSFIVGADRDDGRPAERYGAALVDGLLAVVGALGARRFRDRYRSTSNAELARALLRHARDPASAGRELESEELRDAIRSGR